MNKIHRRARTRFLPAALGALLVLAGPALAQVTLYEHDNFQGRSFTAQQGVPNFMRVGFNDRASSVVVLRDRWEVCDDAGYGGRCVVLRPGSYPSLSAMGLNDRVSSVHRINLNTRVDNGRYAPTPPPPPQSWQRRDNERLYEANVTAVHAVMSDRPGPGGAPSGQRCWVERESVAPERSSNMGGAIVGALLGGILGHQIGGGTGRDLATVGGVVAGAAVGSRVGGADGRGAQTQDVQRCAPDTRDRMGDRSPEYWDVSYTFRGQQHQVQMTRPPGATIPVNRQGEPRG
jgi:uncharacterized protein YcfJ